MTQEKKQEFTRRLSCCNRGEMIVILYDILFSYLDEALKAQEEGSYEEFRTAVGKAVQVVQRLGEDLDFTYPIANELYPVYQFVNKHLALAVCKNTAERNLTCGKNIMILA